MKLSLYQTFRERNLAEQLSATCSWFLRRCNVKPQFLGTGFKVILRRAGRRRVEEQLICENVALGHDGLAEGYVFKKEVPKAEYQTA